MSPAPIAEIRDLRVLVGGTTPGVDGVTLTVSGRGSAGA